MVPALDQDLPTAELRDLRDLGEQLLLRVHVGLGVVRPPVERAEPAVRDAHVRRVDVAVDDVGDDAVRMLALAHEIGEAQERSQVRALVEQERFLRGDPPSVLDLELDRVERACFRFAGTAYGELFRQGGGNRDRRHARGV